MAGRAPHAERVPRLLDVGRPRRRTAPRSGTSAPSPGSPRTALVAITEASGDWLQNVLRPLISRLPSPSSATAAGPQPVGSAAGGDDQLLARHPPQHALGVGGAAAMAEGLQGGQVLVHGRGQGGGAVVAGQLGLGVAHLAQRGAEPAELGGHRQSQVAVLPHDVVGLADEAGRGRAPRRAPQPRRRSPRRVLRTAHRRAGGDGYVPVRGRGCVDRGHGSALSWVTAVTVGTCPGTR